MSPVHRRCSAVALAVLFLVLDHESYAYIHHGELQSTRFRRPSPTSSPSRTASFVPSLPARRKLVQCGVTTSDQVLVRTLSAPTSAVSSVSRTASTFDAQDPSSYRARSSSPGERLRRLKDFMWVREAREDLTAAEFALSVEASGRAEDDASQEETAPQLPKSKRAVDYGKLLMQLNKRIRDMGCVGDLSGKSPFSCTLQSGVGMGSIVYTDEQREILLERILRTRQLLLEVIRGHEHYNEDDLPFSIALPEIRVEIPKEDDPSSPGPKLYVRDDGTVDWDGALQDREALRKFGTAVWARINGRDPESIDENETMVHGAAEKPKVTAKIEETPEIKGAREELDELSAELNEMEKEHIALLSSALKVGQAVANVNLASLEPSQRIEIMESAEALEKQKEQVSFHTLTYEMERIYSYLIGELGNPALNGYIPLQDRLNVAEFGLLESQIETFNRQIEDGETIDADVLAVVKDQLTDFKRRLGIDYYVTGVSFDAEGIRRWLADLGEKTRNGLAFYVKGVRLFWNDIIFCLSLINRAAQGYTLKPREVRTIRRTFKDIVTFIPVVIILLIPLSPVGHVLVFGAIQRFFPDFFPSCFTEQRQNLLQLYENAEYSEFTINENFKEKLARLNEAVLYFITNTSRAIYVKLVALIRGSSTGSTGSSENDPQQ